MQTPLILKQEIIPSLKDIHRGIEKESLRIKKADGSLAQNPHPSVLGASLTHPQITTDYSESLLEFITGVHQSVDGCLQELRDIHHFYYQSLPEEMLWNTSMPCFIADEKDIPIAQYGSSNIGKMKYTYRVGLEKRYGRLMQTIAGVHYNFSLGDDFWQAYQQQLSNQQTLAQFKNEQYFHLIRNFQRYAWILSYLFGASPAVCKSFIRGREHNLATLANGDLGFDDATSLRMGDLGYQSNAQDELICTYNNLDEYIQHLLCALQKNHPEYESIGVKDGDAFIQLSTHLLQIENEFYSIIRPKCVANSGEAPLIALADRGVEYIEVRSMDINPFCELGIDSEQIHFVDSFLLFCLLSPSPECSEEDILKYRSQFSQVVNHGRDADLMLGDKPLKDVAQALIKDIGECAKMLDEANNTSNYTEATQAQASKVDNPELTPSGKIMQLLAEEHEQFPHFYHWAKARSEAIQQHFSQQPMDEKTHRRFVSTSKTSLEAFEKKNQQEEVSFENFLHDYYLQYELLKK